MSIYDFEQLQQHDHLWMPTCKGHLQSSAFAMAFGGQRCELPRPLQQSCCLKIPSLNCDMQSGPPECIQSIDCLRCESCRLKQHLPQSNAATTGDGEVQCCMPFKHSVLTKLGLLWVWFLGADRASLRKMPLSLMNGPLSFENGISGPLRLGA